MTNSKQRTILVLGGTGKTGRRIVERLDRRGLPVRVGSRSAAPPFDWTDRTTWDWTILRSSWFNQNFSEDYLREPVLGGEVALPVGAVPEPFVDADDIADVAVAALTEDGHAGQLYELTGPRLLTFADAVGEISQATGRRVDFVPVPVEGYTAALAAEGVPAEVVDLLTYLFTTVLDGRNAELADGVQRALGRPPRDFAEYARDAAATGAWDRE